MRPRIPTRAPCCQPADGRVHSNPVSRRGAKDVTPSVVGVIQALDAMTMDNSGTFVHTNYGLGLKKSLW